MQKIWNAIFPDVSYTITPSSPVYTLVSTDFYILYTLLHSTLQTAQRVSDSYRNTTGSTAISAILAYCNSNPDLKDDDDNRQEFAAYYLGHLRFLYKDSTGDDPKVSTQSWITDWV